MPDLESKIVLRFRGHTAIFTAAVSRRRSFSAVENVNDARISPEASRGEPPSAHLPAHESSTLRDVDCIDSNPVGERRRDAPFDRRFQRIRLVDAQRVVAVQMYGDFQTNALHTLIARRLRRADQAGAPAREGGLSGARVGGAALSPHCTRLQDLHRQLQVRRPGLPPPR